MIRLRPTSNTNDACRGWARKEAQRSALEGYAAWFATASSSSSTRSGSSSGKGRSYLERWAGIRSTKQSSGSGAALQAPSPSTSTPPVSFFGRTYLLSTVKVPPFPAKAPPRIGATPTRPANGAAVSGQGPQAEEEEEEERVFEWMRAALNGPGAFGSTGFFPGAGAPIVLDLGAVAQDGSPHGRPASRASLAGAARAVRAAGLVPVGVCNTSHDVLRLASEQGLPEVMMVQARPRSSRQSSAPVTASTLPRKPPAAPSPSTRRRASSAERPAESAAAATVAAAAPSQTPPDQQQQQEQQQQQQQQHRYSAAAGVEKPPQAAAAAPEPSPAPAEACGGRAGSSRSEPHGAAATAAADASEEGRDSSSGAVDGPGDQEADRETMVYQGSVRSGQQVFAEGASLVVLGAVSSGGEVMADGDIHVYGTLRGRALAGLSGNKSAKIFATRFDAELVGVGDTFTTCDDPDNLAGLVVDTPTNVCLREDRLVFQSFDLSASGGT